MSIRNLRGKRVLVTGALRRVLLIDARKMGYC